MVLDGLKALGLTLLLMVLAAVSGVLMALGVLWLTATLHAQESDARDIVFICASRHAGTSRCVERTTKIYFNGDWRGVELCRTERCVKFEDIFKESR